MSQESGGAGRTAGSSTTAASVVRDAVTTSVVAEFSTVRDGRPATVPVVPFWDADRDCVVVSSPPAFSGKAERAAANPRVDLLFDSGDGPLHVTGTATVRDDDLEANARAVADLIRAQPASEKRRGLEQSRDLIDSRLGQLLLDWYGLRIVIEVEPETATAIDAPADVGVAPWPDAGIEPSEAHTYDRGVASVVADDGSPRTWPLDRSTFVHDPFVLDPPPQFDLGEAPRDGQPACVLCHGYSPDIQDVAQRLVRGRLRERADDYVFEPASTFRLSNADALAFLRFVVDGKRRTRQYFRERGDSFPLVPWRALLFGP